MQRRKFLLTSAAVAAGVMWPASRGMAAFSPSAENGWRTFEVTLRVKVRKPEYGAEMHVRNGQPASFPY